MNHSADPISPLGEVCPGFTGWEHWAVVTGVDKRSELLHLRVAGVTSMPLICNVRFPLPSGRLESLQHAIMDIAQELRLSQESARDDMSVDRDVSAISGEVDSIHLPLCETLWLRKMLFPLECNAVKRKTLPSVTFRQAWYQENLNYEQMVRNLCFCLANFP